MAFRTWPTAGAAAGSAALIVSKPVNRAQAEAARGLAERALDRSPLNAIATRALAMSYIALGKEAAGERTFHAAERLSRRDIPTQLWLIEDSVARGDIAATLRHYSIAMQTSDEIRPVLLPVLVQAAARDVAIARPLGMILANRPEWWSDFLGRFTEQATETDPFTQLIARVRLDPKSDIERPRLLAAIDRLLVLGAPRAARSLYAAAIAPERRDGPVINGDFEADSLLPPFDWLLSDERDHGATRVAQLDGGGRFSLALGGNRGQEAARQLLVLRPGRYRLEAVTGGVSAAWTSPPTLSLDCFGSEAIVLASKAFSASPGRRPMAMQFDVPARGCEGQRLIITTAVSARTIDDEPWIDNIVVRRIVNRATRRNAGGGV